MQEQQQRAQPARAAPKPSAGVRLRDGVFVLGLVLVAAGVACWSRPAALVVCGAVLMGVSLVGLRR